MAGGAWRPWWLVAVHAVRTPYVQMQVDVLIRDKRSSQVLYETHARHDRVGAADDRMFPLSIRGRPEGLSSAGHQPRTVTVTILLTIAEPIFNQVVSSHVAFHRHHGCGRGTRMKSSRPQVLHCWLGAPCSRMIGTTLPCPRPQQVVITGHGADMVESDMRRVCASPLQFVRQEPQWVPAMRCSRLCPCCPTTA